MKSNKRFYLSILIVLLTAIRTLGGTIAGVIPTSYDVTADGAFRYTLPLRLPPGIKELVPQLSVTYSSQRGDGLMGIGWGLEGLSVISRGSKNIYQDNTLKEVDFNGDIYLLDGQRLYQDASGAYMTEVKNFNKINFIGGTHFEIEYPNGTKYYYGNSTNSRMLAQGRADVLMWALDRIEDPFGNYVSFEYLNQQSTGEYRISKISYGKNVNMTASIAVDVFFTYGSRTDNNSAWYAGSEVRTNVLLSDIEVKFSDGSQANKYHFTYDFNRHSRLTKIEELCNGIDAMPPININWGSAGTAIATATPLFLGGTIVGKSASAGDFNGDGFSDYVATTPGVAISSMDVFMNDKSGGFASPVSVSVPSGSTNYTKLVLDYDGDGLDDVLFIGYLNGNGAYSFYIRLHKANGSSTIFDNPVLLYNTVNSHPDAINFNSLTHIVPGDYDGDTKEELLIVQPYNFNNTNSVADYEVFILGDEYGAHKIHHIAGHIDGVQVVDYDGDRKQEFIFNYKSGSTRQSDIYELKVGYSSLQPQLIQTPTSWPWNLLSSANSFPRTGVKTWPGDFNGDGKTDLIAWDAVVPIQWLFAYSNGAYPTYSGYGQAPAVLNNNLNIFGPMPSNGADISYHVGDFNGDGLQDFLQLQRTAPGNFTSNYNVFFSTGTSFIHNSGTVSIDPDPAKLCMGDFNGDGQIDLLSTIGLSTVLTFQSNNNTLSVESIEHADKTISIDYSRLTQEANYVAAPPINNNVEYLTKPLPIRVVKRVYDDVSTDNSYKYEGLVLHKYGLGLRGFKKFISENVAGQKLYRSFNVTARVPYMTELQEFDGIGTDPFGRKTIFNQLDYDGGAYTRSRIILTYPQWVYDYTKAEITNTIFATGTIVPGSAIYEYGKIASMQIRKTDLDGNNNSYSTSQYQYDSKGRPTSVIIYNEIDPNGNNGITRTTTYTYTPQGEIFTVNTDPSTQNSKRIIYSYDAYGNVTQEDVDAFGIPLFTQKKYEYTDDGKFIKKVTDAENYETSYYYGAQPLTKCWGNILKETNAQLLETEFEYDAINRVTKTIDRSHRESITSINFLTKFTTYEFATGSSPNIGGLSDPHLIVRHTNNDNADYSTTVYDRYGRVIRKVKPNSVTGAAIKEDIKYSNIGLVEQNTPAYSSGTGAPTIYSYDNYNRIVYASTWNGPQIQTTYDVIGGKMSTTILNVGTGKTRTTTSCGETVWQINGPSESITYTYYGNGTTYKTTTNGLEMTNQVDNWGRVYYNVQPNANGHGYLYDALDRITRETFATGVSYDYTYDKLGRRLTKTEVGATTPPYTYQYGSATATKPEERGQLLQITAPNGLFTKYTYSNNGHITKKQQFTNVPAFPLNSFSGSFNTSYSYGVNGKLATYMFPNDVSVNYIYTNWGGVKSCNTTSGSSTGLPSHKLIEIFGRDPQGHLTGAYTFPRSGSSPLYSISNSYDGLGYPVNRSSNLLTGIGGGQIAKTVYTFNTESGNLESREYYLPGPGSIIYQEDFTYDTEHGRLTNVHYSGLPAPIPDLEMVYGNEGNILRKSDVSANQAPGSQYFNWKYVDYALKTVPFPATSNPNPFEIPDKRLSDDYYPFQKIKSLLEEDRAEVKFVYGPEDERISATYFDRRGAGGSAVLHQTKYYGDNFEYIVDKANNVVELYYVWADGDLVAIMKAEQASGSTTKSGGIFYPLVDHLGSITHLLDDRGSAVFTRGIAEERSFDAWGRLRNPFTYVPYVSGSFPANWITDRGYTGHEHIRMDTWNTNIINMNGRLYDPLIGRMFSPDPYVADATNSQDYNKYSYARNNPLTYVDPSGNIVQVAAGIIVGGIIGGAINVAMKYNQITSWEQGLAAFGTGFVAGALGTATGGVGFAAAGGTGFFAGAVGSMVGTAVSAPVLAAGNTHYFNDAPLTNDQYLKSIAFSGLMGGLISGIVAKASGGNFWTGEKYTYNGEVVKLKEVNVTASKPNEEMIRVGRWMKRDEYEKMLATGQMQQGGGGQTFVATSGPTSFASQAPPGSAYVEFDVPKSSLLQGGRADWLKGIGPDAPRSMQISLQKQGGVLLPRVENISEMLYFK